MVDPLLMLITKDLFFKVLIVMSNVSDYVWGSAELVFSVACC